MPSEAELERAARAILAGQDASADELRTLCDQLRRADRTALVEELLIAVARRALDGRWRPDERAAFATRVLRDHQQFGYARRLLARVRSETADSEELRQQHALCTYKDLELAAGLRLDKALAILLQGGPLEHSTSAETLGIAGAIFKRRWEVDAKRADLESALWCYRRGSEQVHDDDRWYAAINAAFVADRVAALEDQAMGDSSRAAALRAEADIIRERIVSGLSGVIGQWSDQTRGEALFGLGRFGQARAAMAAVARTTEDLWRLETTATQLAALARLRGVADDADAVAVLDALVGGSAGAISRASIGKVGVALSGGGFRASLFHIGVLARLAERRVLRHVEVLSCVSGGSIVGAYYYLRLRALLQSKPDEDVTDEDYVELVRKLADDFLAGVRRNLRGRLLTSPRADLKMLAPAYSRTDRVAELLEEIFYGPLRERPGAWRMPDLMVRPAGRGDSFSLRYENWRRAAKVPTLVLNATTLNSGHNWQFTATWMGEPPIPEEQRVDASRPLRRVYYRDAPAAGELRQPRLGKAVAASACVPMLFAPIKLEGLYDGIDVELVDGGVHDNQGTASLIEQDCTVMLISDASGQLSDEQGPRRWMATVASRSNSILMNRVRGAQYAELLSRCRSGSLRGYMTVYLTKGLAAPPRDWSGCQEPWTPADDPRAGNGHGLDPRAQRAMAELRTDLDAFSDDEAYALMAAGYRMTKCDLAQALPGLPIADCALAAGDEWPFAPVLAEMTSTDASRLARSLEPGREVFLRRPKAWLRRRRRR